MGNINKPDRKDVIKSVFNILTLERCYTCTFPAPDFTKFHNNSFVLMSHHALPFCVEVCERAEGGPVGVENLVLNSANFLEFFFMNLPCFKMIVNFKIDF